LDGCDRRSDHDRETAALATGRRLVDDPRSPRACGRRSSHTRLCARLRHPEWHGRDVAASPTLYGAGWQNHAENLSAHILGGQPDYGEARWDELAPSCQELDATLG